MRSKFYPKIKEAISDINRISNYPYFNIYNGKSAIDKTHIIAYNLIGEVEIELKSKLNLDYDKNDFFVASFKSLRGYIDIESLSQNPSPSDTKKERYNLFNEGYLWKKKFRYGKNFYTFLNNLFQVFNTSPISLISKFKAIKENSLIPQPIVVKTEYDEIDSTIFFPKEEVFKTKNYLKQFLEIFKSRLDPSFLSSGSENIAKALEKIKNLTGKEGLGLIDRELMEVEELNKTIHSFERVFNCAFTPEEIISIRRAAFIFQFNRLPFKLSLYYPKTIKNYDSDLGFIMLGVNDKDVTSECDKILVELSELIAQISQCEEKILKKMKENSSLHFRWESEFNERIDAYTKFAQTIKNVCEILGRKNGIAITVSYRIKSFKSFYNKLFERCNDNAEFAKHLADGINYREVLKEPETMGIQIFKHIRDIAGVRLVCTYEEDVSILVQKLRYEIPNGDIKVKPKSVREMKQNRNINDENDNSFNYRATHLTLLPGKKRKSLYENKIFFEGLQCEVQVRSILAHGWADVQHPVEYKNNIAIEEIDKTIYKSITEKLEKLSENLFLEDQNLNKIRELVTEIEFPDVLKSNTNE